MCFQRTSPMAIVSSCPIHPLLEWTKSKPFTGWVGLRRVSKVGQSPIKAGWRDAPLTHRNSAEAFKSDHTKTTATKKKSASNMNGRILRLEVAYPVGYYEISY